MTDLGRRTRNTTDAEPSVVAQVIFHTIASMSGSSTTIIYVELLDEGTEVFRAVDATPLGDDLFTIIGPAVDPDDETWKFPIGSTVRCVWHIFQDGIGGWLAVTQVNSGPPC